MDFNKFKMIVGRVALNSEAILEKVNSFSSSFDDDYLFSVLSAMQAISFSVLNRLEFISKGLDKVEDVNLRSECEKYLREHARDCSNFLDCFNSEFGSANG